MTGPQSEPTGALSAAAEARRVARRTAARMVRGDVGSASAGVRVLEVAPGRAVTALTVQDRHVNGHGICHGGYVFLLADAAFGYAGNSGGVDTVAAGAQVAFLRPARVGDELVAEATVRTRVGRSCVVDVTVRLGDTGGPVVAEFRGHGRASAAFGITAPPDGADGQEPGGRNAGRAPGSGSS